MSLPVSTITTRGQTTLPKRVREALGVGPGDRVSYIIEDDKVRMVVAKPVSRLFGLLKREAAPVTLEEMEHGIIKGARSGEDRARHAYRRQRSVMP